MPTPRKLWAVLLAATLQACGGGSSQDTSAAADAELGDDVRHALAGTAGQAAAGEAAAGQGRHFSGMGMNLPSFDYFSTDFPTIDQFKRAQTWLTSCTDSADGCKDFSDNHSAWDTGEEDKLDLDADGWVKSLPAKGNTEVKFRYATTIMFGGDSGAHPAGTYTVLYDGDGTLEYGGIVDWAAQNPIKHVAQGRDEVKLTNGTDGFTLRIKATSPGNYLRNIRVIPPGGVCSNARRVYVQSAADCVANGTGDYITLETLSATQIWHPSMLRDLGGVRALRFMDWGRTNSSMLASWADRPLKTDAFWTGPAGVPVSVMINLANTLQADAWINLPPHVDDNYARQLARLAKGSLNAQAKLIIEFGNEPWNWQFPATEWMRQQSAERWKLSKDDSYTAMHSWYGMRAVQLCQIVKAEFGAESGRVQCVSNGQAANTWVAQQQVECPYARVDLGGQTCGKYFDAVSLAPYFGGYVSSHRYREEIMSHWLNLPMDQQLDKLFAELYAPDADHPPPLAALTATSPDDKDAAVRGALGQSRQWMRNYKAEVAARYNLPLYTYEGGQHLIWGADESGDTSKSDAYRDIDRRWFADKRWENLYIAANRDMRMKAVYTQMMKDWTESTEDNRNQLFTPFNYAYWAGGSGAWGLKESVFKSRAESPKWDALVPYRDTVPCWWAGCQTP